MPGAKREPIEPSELDRDQSLKDLDDQVKHLGFYVVSSGMS